MRAECRCLLVRGTRISAIAAMCWNKGILDVEMTANSVDGKMFDFVRGTLIPNMLPIVGLNPTSITVMDDCSIHHVTEVKSMVNDAGILLMYLPPYSSPDLNPSEEAFGYVKGYLKKYDDIAAAFPNPRAFIQSAFNSITIEHCKAWINHSKYWLLYTDHLLCQQFNDSHNIIVNVL